jgi:hypothetical protein
LRPAQTVRRAGRRVTRTAPARVPG